MVPGLFIMDMNTTQVFLENKSTLFFSAKVILLIRNCLRTFNLR